MDNIDKEYDEINRIDMIDGKESDKRDQIGESDEDRLTDDIEFLKQGNLSSQKNIDDIDKESDEKNWIDIIDDKESDERDQISKNDEERVTDDIEVFKLVN